MTASRRIKKLKTKAKISSTRSAAMLIASTAALFANASNGEGLDRLTVILNGPQDAAADSIQGADVNGIRPIIGDVAGKGFCQSIATGTNRSGVKAVALAGTGELGKRCSELINAADPDGPLVGAGVTELGISDEGIASALQQVVPEESEIMGSGATDTMHDQMSNVESRMQVIRTGSSALPIAGVHINSSKLGGAASADEFSKLGVFVNGDYSTGDKKATFNENGFDYDAYGITGGVDYRFSDRLVAGVAVGLSKSEVGIDAGAGTTDADGVSVTAYGTYYQDKFYIEASLSQARYNYDAVRNINYGVGTGAVKRTMASDTDGDQSAWSLGAGYSDNAKALNYTFFARLEGLDADVDGYSERVTAANSTLNDGSLNTDWAMRVESQSVESLRSILGTQLAYAISTESGVVMPFLNLEYYHEFEDKPRAVTAFYQNDPFAAAGDRSFAVQLRTDVADKNFFLANIGATFISTGGMQFFASYESTLGLSDVSNNRFTVGVRVEL